MSDLSEQPQSRYEEAHKPLGHFCPEDEITLGAEKLLDTPGIPEEAANVSRATCLLRALALRQHLANHPCEGAVKDKDNWDVCPRQRIVGATVDVAVGSVNVRVKLADITNANPSDDSASRAIKISNPGQYL